VGEKELRQLEAGGYRTAHRNCEDLCASTPGKTSRLRVEVGVRYLRLRAGQAARGQDVSVAPGRSIGRLHGFEAARHDAFERGPAITATPMPRTVTLRLKGGGDGAAAQTGKAVAESSLRHASWAPSTPLSGPMHEGQPARQGHSRTSSAASASSDVCSS